jgi:3-methyladenine DNA glycosylase AlkC
MAASDQWHERETAGFALRDLLELNFEDGFRLTENWVDDPSENIRRAACLACMQRKRFTDEPRLRAVLSRLDRLMTDDSVYVRKCCGPFVVGYLGYTYPRITLPWLALRSRSADPNVRTNVAKAFTQALGGSHPADALKILRRLSHDRTPRVRSAVRSALRNIARRHPGYAESLASLLELVDRS